MTDPHLELAPWEIEPERCLHRDGTPFTFRALWFGSERDFIGQIRSFDEYLFHWWFCLADEPERGNFLCTGKGHPIHPPCTPEWDTDNKSRPEEFVECVENGFWGRQFVLDSHLQLSDGTNGSCIIFLAANGWGIVRFLHHRSAEFQWAPPCALTLAEPEPTLHLKQVLLLAQTPSHSLQFAFQWAKLSHFERLRFSLPLHKGDYEQWTQAIRLYVASTTGHREGWKLHCEALLLCEPPDLKVEVRMTWSETRGGKMEKAENTAFQKFLSWSLHHFSPHRDREVYETHSCVRSFCSHKPRLFSGSIEQLTHHERLEALLQLREWLADKATPAEIEHLLRQD